jgi:hypothetical protein
MASKVPFKDPWGTVIGPLSDRWRPLTPTLKPPWAKGASQA